MAELDNRHPCPFRPCQGEMTLTPHDQVVTESGRRRKTEKAQWLSAWHCTVEPQRHVEVGKLGVRPLKNCTVKGCAGMMVHWGRVRTVTPENPERQRLSSKPQVVYRSGYVCIENAEHFDPDTPVTAR